MRGQQASKVLLVEGQDDKHVIDHLCCRSGAAQLFEFGVKDGIDKLLDSITPEIKAPGREVVGIVVNANDDVAAQMERDFASTSGSRILNRQKRRLPAVPLCAARPGSASG